VTRALEKPAARHMAATASLVAPHVDYLFDRGWMSSTDDGDLMVARSLSLELLQAWGISAALNVGPLQRARGELPRVPQKPRVRYLKRVDHKVHRDFDTRFKPLGAERHDCAPHDSSIARRDKFVCSICQASAAVALSFDEGSLRPLRPMAIRYLAIQP
jgi:hypothetical protein